MNKPEKLAITGEEFAAEMQLIKDNMSWWTLAACEIVNYIVGVEPQVADGIHVIPIEGEEIERILNSHSLFPKRNEMHRLMHTIGNELSSNQGITLCIVFPLLHGIFHIQTDNSDTKH